MAATETIRNLREYGRWVEALESASQTLMAGSYTDKLAVWQEHFLGPDCLPWAWARVACGPKGDQQAAQACQSTVDLLLDPAVSAFVVGNSGKSGPSNDAMLRGIVRGIQAAAAERLGSQALSSYVSEAASAYQSAFSGFGQPGLGQAVVKRIVADLNGRGREKIVRQAETRILLALDRTDAETVKLVVALEPGETSSLVPDPIALGMTILDDSFLDAFRDAWQFVTQHWPCPAGHHVCWRLDGLRGEDDIGRPAQQNGHKTSANPGVGGGSGGAAAAAAFRAVIQGKRLDPFVAISATIGSDGRLGYVENGFSKSEAASRVHCDRVLFAPATVKEVLADRPREGVPRIIEADTFSRAWPLLTGRMRALEAYIAIEQKAIRRRMRFDPRKLGSGTEQSHSSVTVFEMIERLNVPLRVSRVERVNLPRSEAEALLGEREGFSGAIRQGRGGAGRDRLDRPGFFKRVFGWGRFTRDPNESSGRGSLPDGRRRGRPEDNPDLPPGSEELLEVQVRDFVEVFHEWTESWNRTGHPLIVLGDPGYGKSWLTWLWTLRLFEGLVCQMLSLRSAGEASQSHTSPTVSGSNGPFATSKSLLTPDLVDEIPPYLPLRVTCRELGQVLEQANVTLPRAVEEVVAARLDASGRSKAGKLGRAFRRLVRDWFAQDRVIVIADGWDEITPGHGPKLQEAFEAWMGSKHPLLITSRLVGYPNQGLIKDAEEWRLTTLEVPDGVNQLVRRWFGKSGTVAEELLDQLNRRPELLQLVRVPLMGSLVCRMRQQGQIPPMPDQRTLLLERAITMLLTEGCREPLGARSDRRGADPSGLSDPADEVADQVLAVLARLAYRTFNGERWVISRRQLLQALKRLPEDLAELGRRRQIMKALTGRFGMFTEAADRKLEIVHQSFGEFLCARWVAHRFGRSPTEFRDWLRDHAGIRLLDPRRHEVWCHLAALLDRMGAEDETGRRGDAAPLIDELWDMHGRISLWRHWWPRRTHTLLDDVFDTALCLACHCLAASGRPGFRERDRRIIAGLLRRWRTMVVITREWEHYPQRTMVFEGERWIDCPHARALIALGRAAVPHLIAALKDKDRDVRCHVAGALGRIGPSAVDAVPHLITALREEDFFVRCNAALALGRIGPNAVDAVPHLITVLEFEHTCWESVFEALGLIGPGAIDAVPHLITALQFAPPRSRFRRSFAAEALGRIGPNAVPYLIAALEDGNTLKALGVAESLGLIGAGAVDAVPHLIDALKNQDSKSSWEFDIDDVAGDIGRIGLVAVPHLIAALKDEERRVRALAAEALGRIGAGAIHAVPHLITALNDGGDTKVKARAAEALGRIGAGGVHAVPHLITALKDDKWWVRSNAAEALGRIGPNSVDSVPHLITTLKDKNSDVQSRAAEALGRIGPNAVPYLITALKDRGDDEVKARAAEALGRIGAGAVHAVPHLIAALNDGGENVVKASAAEALGRIGAGAIHAVPHLITALNDGGDTKVKARAAEALGGIGAGGVHAVPHLITALKDDEWWVRRTAAEALGRIGAGAIHAVPHLISALEDPLGEVREAAANALGEMGPSAVEAVPSLITALKGDRRSLGSVIEALGQIGAGAAEAVPHLISTERRNMRGNDVAVALGRIGAGAMAAVPHLLCALKNDEFWVRGCVFEALRYLGPGAVYAAPELIRLYRCGWSNGDWVKQALWSIPVQGRLVVIRNGCFALDDSPLSVSLPDRANLKVQPTGRIGPASSPRAKRTRRIRMS